MMASDDSEYPHAVQLVQHPCLYDLFFRCDFREYSSHLTAVHGFFNRWVSLQSAGLTGSTADQPSPARSIAVRPSVQHESAEASETQ